MDGLHATEVGTLALVTCCAELRWEWWRRYGTRRSLFASCLSHGSHLALGSCLLHLLSLGSGGLLLQPFWTPGITNPNARGAIVGFADYHTRHHLYRAIIEGICLELYHGLSTMEKRSKQTVLALYAGGGGARSDVVCQIAADVFGLPVSRIQTHEASAIGAAMVAFVAEGVFADYDDAIAHMVQQKDTFAPSQEAHSVYRDYYEAVYSKLPPRLKPIEKAIAETNRRNTQ